MRDEHRYDDYRRQMFYPRNRRETALYFIGLILTLIVGLLLLAIDTVKQKVKRS